MKVCTKCGKMLSLGMFQANLRAKDGRASACKECYKDYRDNQKQKKKEYDKQRYHAERKKRLNQVKEWQDNNKEKVAMYKVSSHLTRKYGLNIKEFQAILEAQDNKCACCGNLEGPGNERFVVDHDHKTGDVREIICQKCNLTIGLVDDDIDNLNHCIVYLKKHKEDK